MRSIVIHDSQWTNELPTQDGVYLYREGGMYSREHLGLVLRMHQADPYDPPVRGWLPAGVYIHGCRLMEGEYLQLTREEISLEVDCFLDPSRFWDWYARARANS